MKRQSRSSGLVRRDQNSYRRAGVLVLSTAAMAWSSQAMAANGTWNGGAGDGLWSTANGSTGNWGTTATIAPGAITGFTNTDTANFNAIPTVATNTTIVVDLGRNIRNLSFDNPNLNAPAFTIAGPNALLLTAAGTITTTALINQTETISAPLFLESTALGSTTGTFTINDNSAYSTGFGSLNITGNISGDTTNTTTGQITLTLAGSGTGGGTVGGSISNGGAGALALNIGTGSSAKWTLSGANSFTGATNVNGGTLIYANNSAISSTSAITVNGGDVVFGSAITFPLPSPSFTLTAGGVGSANGITSASLLGFVNGLTIAAPSNNSLLIDSPADASTNINFNTLGGNAAAMALGANGNFTYTGTLTPSSTLGYELGGGGGVLTIAQVLSDVNGPGTPVSVVGSGGGSLVVNSQNTYTGVTTIGTGGVLVASNLATEGAGGVPSSLGASSNAATNLVFNGVTLRYIGGVATMDRGFTINTNATIDASGTGLLTLNGAISLQGAAGTRTLTLTGTGSGTLATALADNGSNVGALTKSGAGTWALSTSNNYSGNTTLSAGLLNIGNSGALGTGTLGTFIINGGAFDNTTGSPLTLNNNETWGGNFTYVGSNSLSTGTAAVSLTGNRTVTVVNSSVTIPGIVSNSTAGFGITKQGVGTLALLNGGNSYTGTTTINGGLVALGTTGALGSSSPLTLSNGELSASGSRTVTVGALTDNVGLDTITLTPSGGALSLSAASLGTRAIGATILYRGTNLGTAGAAEVTFVTPPVATTGGATPYGSLAATGTGTLGTTQAAVLRGALADTSATGTGIGFATYDPTVGVRLLTASEQNAVTAGNLYSTTGTGDNVLIASTAGVPVTALSITGKQTNTLQLANSNGSTSMAITASGTLNASNGLLFTGSAPITLSGGTIDVTDSTNAQDTVILSTNTAGVTIGSTISSAGGTTNVSAITFGGVGNFTLTGGSVITKSTGGVFFDGPGTVTFGETANLSTNGLQVLGGTVKLATGFSMPSARAWHVAPGATLDMGGQSPGNVDFLVDINGGGGTITNTSGTVSNLTTNNASTTTGTETFSGSITGNINFAQTVNTPGTSTLVQDLAGQSSYTGTTAINSATVRLGINNAFPTGTALSVNGATGTTEPTTFFDLGGFNQTVGSLGGTIGTATSPNPTIMNSAPGTTSTLTVGGSSNGSYAGIIADTPLGTGGVMALAKSGAGALTLTGVNTFSGGTTINGGTLKANNATASLGSGFVTVNGGGILAGTGNTGSGAVAINSGGKLDPGDNSLATLTVGTGGSLSLAGGSILDYDFTDAGSDEVVVNGGLTLNSTHANPVGLNVFASGTNGKFSPTGSSGTETFNLIQYTGTALPAGTLTNLSVLNPVSATAPWSYTFDSAPGAGPAGSNLVQLVITFPPPESWAGITSSNWGTATSVGNNWSAAQVPSSAGQSVTFPGTASRFTVDLDGSRTVGLISFTGGGANTSYLIDQGSSPSGGIIILYNNGTNASISNKSATSQTISAPISLAAGFSTLITNTSATDALTLSGGITGASTSPIVAGGLGTLALTGGSPAFHGGVAINGGIVQINSSTSLGATDSVATINAGTLEAATGGIVESRNFIARQRP